LQFFKGIVSSLTNISHKAAKHAKNNTLKSFITQYFGIPFLNLYGKVTITETYLVFWYYLRYRFYSANGGWAGM